MGSHGSQDMGVQPGGQQKADAKEGSRGIGASALSTTAGKFGRSPAQHIKGQQPAGSRPTANEKPAPKQKDSRQYLGGYQRSLQVAGLQSMKSRHLARKQAKFGRSSAQPERGQ